MRRYTWLNLIIQKKQFEKKKEGQESLCVCASAFARLVNYD